MRRTRAAPHAGTAALSPGSGRRRPVADDGRSIAARCTRIWCVRPVSRRTREQRVAASSSSTSKCVTAVARRVRVERLPRRSRRSRPIGASIVPRRERGRPRTSARYSRSSSRRAHELLQAPVRLLRARDDHQPGRVAVEPVHDPRPFLLAARGAVREQPVRRASRPRGRRPGARRRPPACRRRAGARPPRRSRSVELLRRGSRRRSGGVELDLLAAASR